MKTNLSRPCAARPFCCQLLARHAYRSDPRLLRCPGLIRFLSRQPLRRLQDREPGVALSRQVVIDYRLPNRCGEQAPLLPLTHRRAPLCARPASARCRRGLTARILWLTSSHQSKLQGAGVATHCGTYFYFFLSFCHFMYQSDYEDYKVQLVLIYQLAYGAFKKC